MKITTDTTALQLASLMGPAYDERDGIVMRNLLNKRGITEIYSITGPLWVSLIAEVYEMREQKQTEFPADFEDWWDTSGTGTFDDAKYTWECAARAERKRIRDIIQAVGVQGNSDAWFDCVDTILEKIDAAL